jgi:uncharacterized phiE125 gp8 family phage protein
MAQLITLTEAKEFLKIDFNDEDALLDRLITQATAIIQRKYQRDLIQATYTDEEYNGEGHDLLFIRNFPVQSVTSLKVDDVALDPSEYTVSKYTGIIKRKSGYFPEGWGNIKVSYTGGFPADDPALEPFKNECLLLVADLFEGRGA